MPGFPVFGTGQPIARYPDAPPVPVTVLVNPVLEPIGTEEQEGWEGCLSVPGLRAVVPRFRHLRYHGHDPHGARIDRTVSDFHARVVQHECDHLDGVLYVDRADPRSLAFLPEYKRYGPLVPTGVADDEDEVWWSLKIFFRSSTGHLLCPFFRINDGYEL